MRKSALCFASVLVASVVSVLSGANAQTAQGPEVSSSAGPVNSGEVRGMGLLDAQGIEQKREKPLRLIPSAPGQQLPDTVIQSASGPNVATTAPIGFAGVGAGDYGFTPNAAPPDTNMAVGPTQIVQWVNSSFIVFDKATHAVLRGPIAGNTLFAALGGTCAANNDGDPVAQYDKIANRWVLTQFAVATQPFTQCVAVSQTSDALGAYNLYAFSYGNGFNDYPKFGVWPDAYYITFNLFTNGQTFAGSRLCAYDRAAMLAGQPATQQCFQLANTFGGVLPGDVDSAAALPPAGAPNPFINFGTNQLRLWRFHVDFANSANSTLTGPLTIPVASFTAACTGGGTCIPQPGTNNRLDSLADRLMYRFAYRGRTADRTAESAVVNHSVTVSGSRNNQVVGVRWYRLANLTSGTPAVLQQGTYSPDSNSRWMGSIAQDKNGNIALGYSSSSSSRFPGLYFTGRLATDAANTLQAESVLRAGGGSQTGNLHRWGDYSALFVDPSDDCTFWYTNEYLKASGSFNWSTWIGSFRFPSCQ